MYIQYSIIVLYDRITEISGYERIEHEKIGYRNPIIKSCINTYRKPGLVKIPGKGGKVENVKNRI